jgi:hypothetical protein
MDRARDNTPGREFQWIAQGTSSAYDVLYTESFPGQAKAFCVYRNSESCGGAWMHQGGAGTIGMLPYFSVMAAGSPTPRVFSSREYVTNVLPIVPESGDECFPYAACGYGEHEYTLYHDGTVAKSLRPGTANLRLAETRGNDSVGVTIQ